MQAPEQPSAGLEWLRRSLASAVENVASWPEWKRNLVRSRTAAQRASEEARRAHDAYGGEPPHA